jgi:hypothetical protein
MAAFDLQNFVRERALVFDENLDVSAGSPFDTEVVQPLLRRLGQDPFTVDLAVFIRDRLRQAFPEMATDEGDALTDLLIKPSVLILDPIVREIFRIRSAQSFKDPTTLTTEEAEALGANIFSERDTGDFSRGTGRIYFSTPRKLDVSPVNFFTSKTGLRFFPDGIQSITLEEMLLNVEGSLYYFDVNVIAENPGVQYDISAAELVTIANIESAVRVTNPRRFRNGSPAETAVEYIDRTKQSVTERSLVTQRGIGAQIPATFPEVTRLAVVGYNDPEMERDLIRGGGLGELLAAGTNLNGELDGQNKSLTSRVRLSPTNGQDFSVLLGGTGPSTGYYITLLGAFSSPPFARDLLITRVVSSDVVELAEQVIYPSATNIAWTLRRKELTLSSIPGGITFPDTALGTVTVPDDAVHVGGAYDVYLRGSSFDETSLVVENVTDADPIAHGSDLSIPLTGQVSLDDVVLDTDYAVGDELYLAFSRAKEFGYTLQILEGANAGSYRVINVLQVIGASPILTLSSAIPVIAGSFLWRLVDTIEIDLVEPIEERVTGTDLQTIQNTDVVQTAGSTNFTDLGVSVNDTLRILNGSDKGDFLVKAIPAFNQLQVDRPLTASGSSLGYTVFRSNPSGGVLLPLVRITGIELLDTTGQPVGSRIPYARPVDVQSRAFQNPGRGAKVSVQDGTLGIVSLPDPGGGFALTGTSLTISFPGADPAIADVVVPFGGTTTAATVVSTINSNAVASLGAGARLAALLSGDRVGILPVAPLVVIAAGTARAILFGGSGTEIYTTADIRSASIPSWAAVTPALNADDLDVVQVLTGNQIGFYGGLHIAPSDVRSLVAGNPSITTYQPAASFAPEIGVTLQVGARSLGSARCFFLEPTSIEFDRDSYFSVTLETGAVVRFFPDPTVAAVRLPPPPTTVMTKDGQSVQSGSTFTSASQDFILSGIRPGDRIELLYAPIAGSAPLADPVLTLALKQLVLSVDNGTDQTITFVNDLPGFPADVSRAGVVEQINDAVGRAICKLNGSNALEFESDVSIVVRGSGTANAVLSLPAVDTSNRSDHAGQYVVSAVATTTLTILSTFPAFGGTVQRQSYRVLRYGAQRISSTQMNSNKAEASLYYFDVELVSEGTGELWNVDADQPMLTEGYRSDGYYLTTEDENLSFSAAERPKLHLSRSILEIGVSDSPLNSTQITGQNIEISYERSILVGDVQNFVSSETERVVCANPLARHLIPHFVRFDLDYTGGATSEVVLRDLETYIKKVYPSELLESSDIQNIAYRRGAQSVQNPLSLVAIVHHADRTILAQRSENALNTGRLAAFIPDVLNINRRTT